jgi:hypothetical protein
MENLEQKIDKSVDMFLLAAKECGFETAEQIEVNTIPQSLIKRAIGICECMKAAREARVGVRVMRMYAAESDRITSEFRKYGC